MATDGKGFGFLFLAGCESRTEEDMDKKSILEMARGGFLERVDYDLKQSD